MMHEFEGKKPKQGERVFIAPTACVIGDVVLGDDSSVWYHTVLRGDIFPIRIGVRTNIQDLCVGHVTGGEHALTLGDEVTVGHRVILHGCTIKDRSLIGMGAVVMDAAEVGEEAMVGAGAIVIPKTKIPPRTLALGAPAKVKRDLTSEEIQFLKLSALHYVELAKRHRQSLNIS